MEKLKIPKHIAHLPEVVKIYKDFAASLQERGAWNRIDSHYVGDAAYCRHQLNELTANPRDTYFEYAETGGSNITAYFTELREARVKWETYATNLGFHVTGRAKLAKMLAKDAEDDAPDFFRDLRADRVKPKKSPK